MQTKQPPADETSCLHPWQEEAYGHIGNRRNSIISAPTGSGKTTVAYLWAGVIDKRRKPKIPPQRTFFTAPIKALSNERYMELKKMGLDVGIETGDIKRNTDARTICCTQEIYTLKYAKLPRQKCVVDEFHFVFQDPARSRSYIEGIKETNALSDILFMSATFGNLDRIRQYIEKISGRALASYQNDQRITETYYIRKMIRYDQLHDAIVFIFSRRGIDAAARAIAFERPTLKSSKIARLDQIASILETRPDTYGMLEKGVATYHGGLLPKEKMLIENAFREGILDVVVGTDALALGVNLPAQIVAFGQLAKQNRPITRNEFMQMAGRAGRKGYFDAGYVGILQDWPSFEARYYRTPDLFQSIVLASPEDPTISPQPKIKELFERKTTVRDEALFIATHSLPEADPKEVHAEIVGKLKDIFSNMTVYTDDAKAERYETIVADTWSDELTVRANLSIAQAFFLYDSPHVKGIADIIAEDEPNYLQALLKTKKYLRQIPKTMRVDSRHTIDNMIKEIDPTVFDFEERLERIQKG